MTTSGASSPADGASCSSRASCRLADAGSTGLCLWDRSSVRGAAPGKHHRATPGTCDRRSTPRSRGRLERSCRRSPARPHVAEQTAPGPTRSPRPSLSVGAVGHAPGAKVRAIPPGRAVALPLPQEGVFEHPDMLGGGEWRQVGAPLSGYAGGVLPDNLVRAVRDAQRVRQMTQQASSQPDRHQPPATRQRDPGPLRPEPGC